MGHRIAGSCVAAAILAAGVAGLIGYVVLIVLWGTAAAAFVLFVREVARTVIRSIRDHAQARRPAGGAAGKR